MASIREFIPPIYDGFSEIDTLVSTEDVILDDAENNIAQLKNNQYVVTSDAEGIAEYEKILGIIAAPSESINFRRGRVVNRLSMIPPLTFRLLKKKLDEIIGVGKWTAYIDFINKIIYVESSAQSQDWFRELMITMVIMKPANMVFINKPLISYNIKANESIGYAKRRYNYKLGSWKLGELPFRTLLDRGIVKMSDVLSFNSKYLDDITIYSMSDISSILLNNSVSIVDITKTLVDHCGIVEYVVAKGTADAITNIKFLDSDQNVLTSSDVYVPLDADVEMKHTIVVKEGV